ncbi:MAG: transcriptional regulator protein [Candidatus Methanoperedens sp.]|nr:transcriptional regulator protein [Candidatus Methanoperedens sp.]
MKNLKIKQLDEKGEEIADALMSLGLSRNISMSLAFLQNMNTATSLDLERSARLRQPEVSIAMRELKERDWVDEREEKKPGKGRPFKIYTLKVGFNEIVAQLEKEQKKIVDESQKKIKRLKELGK